MTGGWQRWLFIIIAIAISVVLLFGCANPVDGKPKPGFYAHSAGAIGNVADRLMYCYVIDFFDVHYQGWHWPAFNVADMAITIGAALMLLEAFFDNRFTN